MDLATGAMGSLLPKLVDLLNDEYILQKGIKKDVKFLEGELRSMHAALTKVGDVPRDQLDELVKIWADDVRDLSYDMEDVADSYLVRVEGFEPDANSHKLKRLMKQMGELLSKGKTRHKIAGEIKDIKVRVKEVSDRRDRYRVDSIVANPAATTSVDPRLLALYKENHEIVGTEEARDELIRKLTGGDTVSKHQLKVLSIFGFGGLGKTTLAKEVYDRLQAQYDCKAFVVVGRNPDLKKVFKDILIALDKQKYMGANLVMLDERQLIDELREQLMNKRYVPLLE
jgi:molybdopterin-guanine dinucleotide biosynthesis protein